MCAAWAGDAKQELRKDYIIPQHRCIVRSFSGDRNLAAFFEQLLYWTEITTDPDGWFYKTQAEFREEIMMSPFQIRKLVAILEELNLLETNRRPLYKKSGNLLFYRMNEATCREWVARALAGEVLYGRKRASSEVESEETSSSNNLNIETFELQETSSSDDFESEEITPSVAFESEETKGSYIGSTKTTNPTKTTCSSKTTKPQPPCASQAEARCGEDDQEQGKPDEEAAREQQLGLFEDQAPPGKGGEGESDGVKYSPEFEIFWRIWPENKTAPFLRSLRKRKKGDAYKAWTALKPTKRLIQIIYASVEAHKDGAGWHDSGGQYIPLPGTWLRASGWDDPVTPWTAADEMFSSDIGQQGVQLVRGLQAMQERGETIPDPFPRVRCANG